MSSTNMLKTLTGLILTSGITAAAGLSVSSAAFAQRVQEPFYGHHMWGGGWFFGPIMMIVFIAIAVVAVVLLLRWLGGASGGTHISHSKAPLDVLKERFAKGEIDREDFEERRQLLSD